MDLLYLLKVLYRRKWIISFLTLLAVTAAFIFLLFKKPLYESLAQYSTGFTAEKVKMFDGSSAVDLYTADVKFNNVIETFKSPRVIGMLSYKLLLHDLETPSEAYRKLTLKQTQAPLYKSVSADTAIKVLREKIENDELLRSDDPYEKKILAYLELYRYDYFELRKFMFINRVERTDYLNIVFRSENPELSAVVVNTMGEEFINYYKNLNYQRTEENVASIKDLVSQQQNKIDSLDRRLLEETISQGTIDPVSRSTSAMETVKELETKLAEENSRYNLHKNRLEYLRERLKSLEGTETGNNTAGSSNEEIIKLTNRKNELVEEYERKGGTDTDLERQIKNLRSEIISKSNSGSTRSKDKGNIDLVKNQVNEEIALMNAASTTIKDFNEKIRRYMGMTNVSPGSTVKISVIKDKLEMENKQLSSFKEKYSQAEGLSKDDPTTNFKQTLIGQPAVEPEPRKAIMTMGLSGISMLFLTSVVFLFLEIFDTSLKTSSNFSKTVNLNLASVLNTIDLKQQRVGDAILEDNTGKKYIEKNLFKNNIRKLRHEITESGKKIFLITSTKKQAGKSTVIEALALSLLLSKKKVLLIDLNFSNNTLTRNFNPPAQIQDIANKIDYTLPIMQQKVISNTNYPGLDMIGCIEGNFTPSEILHNIKMDLLLDTVQKEYDFILIEGAALNNYADSVELSDYVQGVYTVFSADSSISQTDKESIQFLYSLKEKNCGTILNKVQPENLNF